jgi:hypothetical protein
MLVIHPATFIPLQYREVIESVVNSRNPDRLPHDAILIHCSQHLTSNGGIFNLNYHLMHFRITQYNCQRTITVESDRNKPPALDPVENT